MIARLMIDDQFGTEHLGMRSRDLSDAELGTLIDTMVHRLYDLNHAATYRQLYFDELDSRECLVRMIEWIQQGGDHD